MGGLYLAPQKMKFSQKFRRFFACLVSEIPLFVHILRLKSKLLKVLNSKNRGGIKMPEYFFVYILAYNSIANLPHKRALSVDW